MNFLQLEQCVLNYGKDIYSFCMFLTKNKQEAEELYQDTFLKATEKMEEIEYHNNPKSYLISIALRLWKNKNRKTVWRQRIAGIEVVGDFSEALFDASGSSPEETVIQKEILQIVREAVATLEKKYRIPIYLHYTVGLSVEEISTVLKIPQGTVKTRLFQARKQLKNKLEVVLDEK